MKSACIGYLVSIIIGAKRTTDSDYPHRVPPWLRVLEEIREYRLPSNHCRRRGNGPRIRVSHLQLLLRASKLLTVSFLTENVLLTRLQTNKRTNLFNFVRPSVQSREYYSTAHLTLFALKSILFWLYYAVCDHLFRRKKRREILSFTEHYNEKSSLKALCHGTFETTF